jgi:hypothetical protein
MNEPIEANAGFNSAQTQVLVAGEARDAALAEHPLTLDRQLLQTPGIHMALKHLRKAIKFRRYGLAFWCVPRGGKTWAIDALLEILSREFPAIPVFCTEALQHDDPTEKATWKDMLDSIGHIGGKTAQEMRTALVNCVVTSAQLKSNSFVILFVDEAQNWSARQWRFIKGLVNTLRNRPYRIRMLVVSFGQSDLIKVREDMMALPDKGKDLIARFLANVHPFPGSIASSLEIGKILAQLDDPRFAEYPKGSGLCYTQFFLPLAYAAGWRLVNEAQDVWRAFAGPRRKKNDRVSMLHLMNLLREFFLLVEDAAEFKSTPQIWKSALTASFEDYT